MTTTNDALNQVLAALDEIDTDLKRLVEDFTNAGNLTPAQEAQLASIVTKAAAMDATILDVSPDPSPAPDEPVA